MDNVACNDRNEFTDWAGKCRTVAYDFSLVRLPSLNRIGICEDVPSIGPLLTYHSQLDDLDLKQSASQNDDLWTGNGTQLTLTLSTKEEPNLEKENMSKKRDSIVEARLAFVADMVETKTNQENGEVEEVSRRVHCFLDGENEEKLQCFGRENDGTLQRFECIRTMENPLRVECHANEVSPSEESSLVWSSEGSQFECQTSEELQNEQSPEEKFGIDLDLNENHIKVFHGESKEDEATINTLEDIERERRKIIEKQVVRRKKIESWTVSDCICQEETIVDQDQDHSSSSLQLSLQKYKERKEKKSTSPTFEMVPNENYPYVPHLVDFGSILEKKQELKHFWERKMMEVVVPSIEETRLPPIVVNGHCKLKQNGVIKCQETGMSEPEMCRRPSPEGEESCVVSETTEKVENDVTTLQKEDFQPEGKEERTQEKEEILQEAKIESGEAEPKVESETETKVENGLENKPKTETEEVKVEQETEEVTVPSENTNEREDIETNLLEPKTNSNEQEDTETNLLEPKTMEAEEKPIIPEIEITTCGENQIDSDEPGEPKEEEETYEESVLDREIRMQQEREESVAKERETAKMESGITEVRSESPPKSIPNQMPPTERPYCNQTTESRIALEIREMREREEELKRMRENITVQTPQTETVEKKETVTTEKEQTVAAKKAVVNENVPSNLGMFKKRDRIKVRPLEDVEDENKPIYKMSKESPIEKEIRLLKEREEELRREKGLIPPLKKTETTTKVIKEWTTASSVQGGDTQRLLATNRIQQEIEEQTRRELDLKEKGHIRTISRDTEERPVNGSIGKSAKFLTGAGKENVNNVQKEDVEQKFPTAKKDKVDARFPLINRRNVSAESKIQQELLEMKAREEELRQQRLKISDQSQPNQTVSVNGNGREDSPERMGSHLNVKDQNKIVNNDVPINGRRRRSALIAQWEQRIQNKEGKS